MRESQHSDHLICGFPHIYFDASKSCGTSRGSS
jgi:hypothetical protein